MSAADSLGLALRGAFGAVIASLLPVLVAVAVVAAVVGLLAARLGLRDPAIVQIARTLAVVATVGLMADDLAAVAVDYARGRFAALGTGGATTTEETADEAAQRPLSPQMDAE